MLSFVSCRPLTTGIYVPICGQFYTVAKANKQINKQISSYNRNAGQKKKGER